MPIALDRAPRYFGTQLSENIAERPEGYLICRNVPIARTGFQKYKVSELADPEGLLGDRSPDQEIDVWRDPAEVFSPATIASFEGVSVTLQHPDDLLDPDSEQHHAVGHVENVRKGPEALESGDWPLLGDVIIKAAEAIRAVKNGVREVSCGYTYRLARTGYRVEQREIRGNHVAIVPKGRAGEEARIHDAAPREETVDMKILQTLFGKGFSFAKDAKPEDIAAVTRAIAFDESADRKDEKIVEIGGRKLVSIGKTSEGVEVFKAVAMDDDVEAENRAAMDKKKRLHDMLDRMLADAEEEEKKKTEEETADAAEIKRLFDKFLGEGADDDDDARAEDDDAHDDDAHPEGCRCDACKSCKDDDGKDAEVVEPGPELKPEDRPKSAFDAEFTIGLLRMLKPQIAKADKATQKRFARAMDALTAQVKQQKTENRGSYSAVRAAAGKLKDEAGEKERVSPAQHLAQTFEATYAEEMKKRREAMRRKR